jgi:hypothetical protein
LALMPLTWFDYIVFKIKKGETKWINLVQHIFTRKQL